MSKISIQHHPDEVFLLDYASGALGEAWSIAIATHLSLCPDCRRAVAGMESIGAGLMEALEPVPVSPSGFESLMARIDGEAPEIDSAEHIVAARPSEYGIPQPLRSYVENAAGKIEWQRLGRGASQCLIETGQDGATARLLRIPAGKPVPAHTHRGLEFTLVLSGAFSDTTGRYARGDMQEADDSLDHQPWAEPGEDCICLAITEAPLRFKSLAARAVQPFLGI